jgi:hypothetical protein
MQHDDQRSRGFSVRWDVAKHPQIAGVGANRLSTHSTYALNAHGSDLAKHPCVREQRAWRPGRRATHDHGWIGSGDGVRSRGARRCDRSPTHAHAGHQMKCSASPFGGSPRRFPMYWPRGISITVPNPLPPRASPRAPRGVLNFGQSGAFLLREQQRQPVAISEREPTGVARKRGSPGRATPRPQRSSPGAFRSQPA